MDNVQSSINQRIIEIEIFAKKKGIRSLPNFIDYPQANYAHVVGKRQSKPSIELIGAIMESFPEIDPYWLVNGTGEMIKVTAEEKMRRFFEYDHLSEPEEPNIEVMVPIKKLNRLQSQIDEVVAWMREMQKQGMK